MADDLRELVRAERRLKGMSVRAAAVRGGCSNTTWAVWENGGALGPAVRRCVVNAFGWPDDWPENPPASRVRQPELEQPSNADLLAVLAELRAHAEYTNLALRAIADVRGIPLPAPPAEAEGLPAGRAGRRKGGRR